MRRKLSICMAALAAALFCLSGGCNVLGVAAHGVAGSHQVKAQYVPAPKEPMLVLVESYGLEMDAGIETQRVATSLVKAIQDNKIALLVDEQKLERLRDSDPDAYRKMTIAEIGRAVGARQILYANIWMSQIERPAGSGQSRGNMRATVKIVDADSADSLWPADGSSNSVEITTPWVVDNGSKSETDLREQMSDQMAQSIGNLFHDSEAPEGQMQNASMQ